MSRTPLFLALALIAPAPACLAQAMPGPVSYSYFDFGVQHVSPDADELDSGTGLAIRGAGAIDENWHVYLGWNRTPFEGGGAITAPGGSTGVFSTDDDIDRFGLGIGYNLAVGAQASLFVRGGWERVGSADFDVLVDGAPPNTPAVRVKSESVDGYGVEVGVRGAFGPRFEAGISARHTAFDDPEATFAGETVVVPGYVDDSSTSILAYGQFKFGNGWGVIAEGDFSSEYSAVFVGARLSY